MKALIVEDKEYIRDGLCDLLQILNADIVVVGGCESVKEAVVVANSCKPDLVFLDINLTDGNGFDFIEQTKELSYKTIFITAYEEHALKALKVGAVDYLLKPVDLEELQLALQKVAQLPVEDQKQQLNIAKQIWDNDKTKIVLSLHDSFQVIDLKDLLYCESDKGYTTFYCRNSKKYVVSKIIKEFEPQLCDDGNFMRPHQSFIVNLDFVDKYDKSGTIYLKNGKKIPVSSRKKEEFLTSLLKLSKYSKNASTKN